MKTALKTVNLLLKNFMMNFHLAKHILIITCIMVYCIVRYCTVYVAVFFLSSMDVYIYCIVGKFGELTCFEHWVKESLAN